MQRSKESRVQKLVLYTIFILVNALIMMYLSNVLTKNYQVRKQVDLCEESIAKGYNYVPNCFFGDEYNYNE